MEIKTVKEIKQFLSSKEINYEELKMINEIIDILESNRNFVLIKK